MRISKHRHTGGPRSKRTREAIAMRATDWTPSQVQMRIVKGLYPPFGTHRPAWAELARKHGWMTLAAFLLVPAERGPGPFDLLYAESPFFRMLKQTTFDPEYRSALEARRIRDAFEAGR